MALKIKKESNNPLAMKYKWFLETEKGREMDTSFRASRRKHSCQHFDFSPVRLLLNSRTGAYICVA